MRFFHSADVWRDHPDLVCAVLALQGATTSEGATTSASRFEDIARSRLADASEGQMPEIKAWRSAFGRMGLKPTQYRCAAEALLRRFRREDRLPQVHPLVDYCNAVSMAFAIPIALFDKDRIAGDLEVRAATGDELYTTFAGEDEHPDPGEIVFADDSGRAHARRWTNRQSGYSAVRDATTQVLMVCEALHESAAADIAALVDAVCRDVGALVERSTLLDRPGSQFADPTSDAG